MKERAIVLLVGLGLCLGLAAEHHRQPPLRALGPARVLGDDPLVDFFEGRRMRFATIDGESLRVVPGVGPALARRLLEARDEEGGSRGRSKGLEVRGLGPKRRAALARYVDVPPSR